MGKSNQIMPNYANYAHLILLNTHHTNTKAYMQSWAVDYAYMRSWGVNYSYIWIIYKVSVYEFAEKYPGCECTVCSCRAHIVSNLVA